MTNKNDIFTQKAVHDYEKHLASFPAQEHPKRLKIFINKAGIIRRLLPSTENESMLIHELSRLMEIPLPETTIKETEKLLSEDRRERMFKNSKLIFKKPKKKNWFNIILGKERDP